MTTRKTSSIGTLLEAHLNYVTGNYLHGNELLIEGIADVRASKNPNLDLLPPDVLSQLCANALRSNIEPEFFNKLIKRNNLELSPGIGQARSLSSVKIFSMGRFATTMNDVPLAGKGNSQRKPLELLQVIVALGGRDVCIQRICDCIWPEVEGDAAYQNFTVTLFRLRKLISSNSIILQDRRITLDSSQCWVDVWELERLLGRLEGLGTHLSLPYSEISENMKRILELYSGPFLGEGEVQSWAISLRERLRSRFIRILMLVGRAYEQMDNCDEAIGIFQKAIELDPLAEEFHQRLISCLAEKGRYAEAISAYQRCEQTLASVLRVTPAQETMAMYKKLQELQKPELHMVSNC